MTENAMMSGESSTTTTPRNYFQFKSPDATVCGPPNFKDDGVLILVFGVILIIGMIYTFTGYRYLKFASYVTGFSLGFLITYSLITNNQPHNISQSLKVCLSLFSGFLLGLITMLIQMMGLFLNGFHGGVSGSYGALAMYDHTLEETVVQSVWPSMMLMTAGGFLMGVVNLYSKKSGTIIATSIYGGAMMAVSSDFFIERLTMARWSWERARLDMPVPPPCPLSWLVLSIWPIASILGMIIQFTMTGTGLHHVPSIASQKRRQKTHPPRLTREQRAELREKKFRYLYQVRTAHGDVISQSYVQALQKTKSDQWNCASGVAGECSTLQSDSTHLTVLPTEPTLHTDSEEDMHQIRVSH